MSRSHTALLTRLDGQRASDMAQLKGLIQVTDLAQSATAVHLAG
jgi:hypothetical protein